MPKTSTTTKRAPCKRCGKRHPVQTPCKRCGKRHRPCGPGAANCAGRAWADADPAGAVRAICTAETLRALHDAEAAADGRLRACVGYVELAVEALEAGAALASPDDAVRLGSAPGVAAVDLTAGAPVLVIRGMPRLPTGGVVFAGRALIDTLAHTAVNAAGLSALACVAVVPVPDDVDAKGRPRDTAIVPSGLFPAAPAVRFVSVQDRGGEARLALPGRAQDPELPLLAAAGLVDKPPAAPMLALVNAAGLGTFASGRGARLDKRFLIYSLASMPLAYRQPGARYEHRQPLRWWVDRLFGKNYRPNKHGPMMLAGLEGLIHAKVQLPDGTYWRPVLPRQDPEFGNLDSTLRLDIAFPDACDRGAAVPWQPLIEAGRKSDPAFDLVLGLAFLWDRAKAANGGWRIYATRPKSRRNHAGALVDAAGNVITARADAPRRGKAGRLAWPAGDVPVLDWRHPAAVIDGVERHPNADRVPALTREERRRLVFPNVARPVHKSARSNQRASADALIEALAVALQDAPPRIVIERLSPNRWRLLEVTPAGVERAFP